MRRIIALALLTVSVTGPLLAAGDAGAGEADTTGVLAQFEGGTINLAEGWKGARACNSDGLETVCFRTAAEADAALAKEIGATAAPESACASALKLYSGTSYSGSVLNLTNRGTWTNLSGYGFDSITSSYKVGACSVIMKDGLGGGGSNYPGSTAAFTNSPSMVAGWDNRIRSVFIN